LIRDLEGTSVGPFAKCVWMKRFAFALVLQKEGFDEDDGPGVEALRRYLRENTGLSEDVIDAACEIAAREAEPEAKDKLPVSGPRHALFAKESREPGEKAFRDPDNFSGKYPEAAKVKSYYEPPESERPLTARDRQLARDSVPGSEASRRFEAMFPEPARIGIGPWPPRR
jgi:hypothetical protein